jgi:hypothetical protein
LRWLLSVKRIPIPRINNILNTRNEHLFVISCFPFSDCIANCFPHRPLRISQIASNELVIGSYYYYYYSVLLLFSSVPTYFQCNVIFWIHTKYYRSDLFLVLVDLMHPVFSEIKV